jgi:hypothetical protein
MSGQITEWVEEYDRWSRTAPGRPGEPNLSLNIYPDPDDEDEPWMWEVTGPDADDESAEYELGLGGAASLDEAKAAADAVAAAHRQAND